VELPIVSFKSSVAVVSTTEDVSYTLLGSVAAGPCLTSAENVTVHAVYLSVSAPGTFPANRVYNSSSTTGGALQLPPSAEVWNPEGLPVLIPAIISDGGSWNPRNFRTRSLLAGSYALRLCGVACFGSTASRTCSAQCSNIQLIITRPPFVVTVNGVLSGGRVVLSTNDLSLAVVVRDASINPQTLTSSQSNWTCAPANASAAGAMRCTVSTDGAGALILAGVAAGQSYTINFTRSYVTDDRVAAFTGTVYVVGSLVIRAGFASPSPFANGKFDNDTVVTIAAAINGSYDTQSWKCPTCPPVFQSALRNPSDHSLYFMTTSPDGRTVTLSVLAAIAPGAVHTYVLTVKNSVLGQSTSASTTVAYRLRPSCSFSADYSGSVLMLLVSSCSGASTFLFGVAGSGQNPASGTALSLPGSDSQFIVKVCTLARTHVP
jgi:hypothetical protein